jgi:TolA-binding protein
LGRLLLAQGQYAGALAEFDRQLASGGALAEEALLWRARTLRKMGDSTAEQQAFRLLLERYPNSAYEQEARSRLDQ